jgi:hypothetical protein
MIKQYQTISNTGAGNQTIKHIQNLKTAKDIKRHLKSVKKHRVEEVEDFGGQSWA